MEKTSLSGVYPYGIGLIMGRFFLHDGWGVFWSIVTYVIFGWLLVKLIKFVKIKRSLAHK